MSEDKLLASLGAAIRAWRKKAGLTMSQLGELAGVDPGFLAYIETGKKAPSLGTVAKIARALNVSLARLFQDVSQEPDADYRLHQQVKTLFHGRNAAEKADLAALFKQLNDDPARVRALRQLIKK
jgi:transcriptional regulator with XRE-family HTH domain